MKTYKKTKINYNFPEIGTKAWCNALKKACEHPGFKLKAPTSDNVHTFIKHPQYTCTARELSRYQAAIALVLTLAK